MMPEQKEQLKELQRELMEIDQRRAGLLAEIQELKGSVLPKEGSISASTVSLHSAEAEKIRLFRSRFAGRDDVFPRRFESRKSGRSGYQPVCANEWRAGVCFKPKVKCAKCDARKFVPVSDEMVRQHLSGKDAQGKPFVMGIYPLRLDETCSFLAVDFDKAMWKEDALAFFEACDALEIAAYLERSRSGNGGHVWLFFAEPLPAGLVRKLGSFILTKAMNARPELGFDSYDRFFPNQDRMPAGGFGNLIALPLQKGARGGGAGIANLLGSSNIFMVNAAKLENFRPDYKDGQDFIWLISSAESPVFGNSNRCGNQAIKSNFQNFGCD
jgi:hypothetical protein